MFVIPVVASLALLTPLTPSSGPFNTHKTDWTAVVHRGPVKKPVHKVQAPTQLPAKPVAHCPPVCPQCPPPVVIERPPHVSTGPVPQRPPHASTQPVLPGMTPVCPPCGTPTPPPVAVTPPIYLPPGYTEVPSQPIYIPVTPDNSLPAPPEVTAPPEQPEAPSVTPTPPVYYPEPQPEPKG